MNDDDRIIRFGTCKRSAGRLVGDLANFDGHVGRFLAAHPRYKEWTVQKAALAPAIDADTRRALEDRGVLAQDIGDLLAGLPG